MSVQEAHHGLHVRLTSCKVFMSDELAACRIAAEQGDAAAQYALGLKCYYGEGVSKNKIVVKQK